MRKEKKELKKGFLMVEVLVAASIIAVAVLSAMAVSEKSIYIARRSMHSAQAAFLLEEGAEAVRIIRDNGWANITSLNTGSVYYPLFESGTWTLSSTPNTAGAFTRTVSVTAVERDGNGDIAESGTVDPGSRLFTITVFWQEGGAVMEKSLQFYIMDIFS